MTPAVSGREKAAASIVGPPVLSRDLEVLDHGPPDVELCDLDPVEGAQIFRRVLEKGPLAPFESADNENAAGATGSRSR